MSQDLERIKREIAELKQEYSRKMDGLLERVSILEQSSSSTKTITSELTQITPIEKPAKTPSQLAPPVEENKKEIASEDNPRLQEKPPQKYSENNVAKQVNKIIKNDVVETALHESLLRLLGPFSSLFQPLVDLYLRYKKEEKLAVFFLTFSGVLALVIGSAYILQYSFSNLLNETAKTGICLFVSIVIIVLGVQISIKKSRMQEFGASLIGLGVILIYLCLYFMSMYYTLVSPTIGMSLLVANTIAGYILALRFETKVVAGIALIGGAFTPLLLGSIAGTATFYAAYLLVLSAAALHLSQIIRWPSLGFTSFFVVIGLIEYVIVDAREFGTGELFYGLIVHGIFYIYVYYNIFSGKTLLDNLDKKQISIVAASTVFLLANIYTLTDSSISLGLIYLANALPFIALIFPLKIAVTTNQRAVMMLLAGSFIGFAIPALVDINIAGLFWAIEGLILLNFGYQFKSTIVRREGYLLVIISMIEMIWNSLPFGSQWHNGLLDYSYLNLLSIGPVLWGIVLIIHKRLDVSDRYDLIIKRIADEFLSLWLAITFIVTTYYIAAPYHLLLSVVPLFYLLYRGHKHELKYTQFLGFAHYGLILMQILLSVEAVGSHHFSDQTLIGKLAIGEALLLLAVTQLFFEKIIPDSKWMNFVKGCRITFLFLLPLIALPTIDRRMHNILPMAIWGSMVTSYLIASWHKHPLLRLETMVLYGFGTIYSIAFALTSMPVSAVGVISFGLYIGPLAGLFIVLQEKGLTRPGFKQSWCGPILSAWFIHSGIVVTAIVFVVTSRVDISLMLLGAYFMFLAHHSPCYPALRQWLRPLYWSSVICLVSVVLLHIIDQHIYQNVWIIMIMNFLILAGLFRAAIGKGAQHKLITAQNHVDRRKVKTIELWAYHILTIVTYISALYVVTGDLLGPALTIALVIHATVILFTSLNEEYKSTMHMATMLFGVTVIKIFFNDLEGFSLIQKILAFMVIGVVLLGSAYKFQHYRIAQEKG